MIAGQAQTIGIIGSGTMGRGIAQTIAATGIEVYIVELTGMLAKEAIHGIGYDIDAEIAKWGMTESDKRAILARISSTADLSVLNKKRVEIVIECVPEELNVKRKVFKQIE